MQRYVKRFTEVAADMIEQCGGKGAHLGELTQAGYKVPQGFSIVSQAYFDMLNYNKLDLEIEGIANSIDFSNYKDVEQKTQRIRELIENCKLPPSYEEISQAYIELVKGDNFEHYVAVRSSVAVKGTTISSFPGMMDTYHYIQGIDQVIRKVRECWGSLWTSRAAMMRYHKGINHFDAIIAPVIQRMVDSEVAGVLFTANPINSSKKEIVIESNWGLGESVVSGKSINDLFILDKESLEISTKKISDKNMRFGLNKENGIGRKEYVIEQQMRKQPSLNNEQLTKLGEVGKSIEKYFGVSQDIEWAFENGNLYILQARKIRTLKQ